MEEQINVLYRIDERQAAADVSTQPIPQLPATSSSVWGALLRSRLSKTIQPQVDRWRSGLDALLVFLGLFSAIVTAFLVDSLTGLQQDEAARTNELLANLTEIIIQLNAGATVSTLQLSVAALAVTCRGFLNMTTLSSHDTAAAKLVDINTRWKAAEKLLGPALEIIPQLLVILVILFVIGLLDSIFSSTLRLEVLPVPIAAASGLSFSRPDSSPFQSNLARVISKAFKIDNLPLTGPYRPWRVQSTYHQIVQVTHDDDTLDKAAAALLEMLETFSVWRGPSHHDDTLSHLLSAEASILCNHTAAQVIVHLEGRFTPSALRSPSSSQSLVFSLVAAARRSANYRPLATLWTSTYVKALAVLVGAFHQDHPAVVCILGSSYAAPRYEYSAMIILDDLLLRIFFDYFHSASPDGSLTAEMVRLFEPDFIVPRHVLRSLHRNEVREEDALLIISLLMAAKTPAAVMAAARDLVERNSNISPIRVVEMPHAPSPTSEELMLRMPPVRVAGLVAKSFLASFEDDGGDSHLLAELCTTCIAALTRRIECKPGEDIVRWLGLVQTMEMAEARLAPSPASIALAGLMADFRESHPRLRSMSLATTSIMRPLWKPQENSNGPHTVPPARAVTGAAIILQLHGARCPAYFS
ncbi:hypothetical protein FB451DRAFT_1559009 [Mycena latifolia]|nr:hypothetical protein FB451DRAFT_1559009 [Mycena latifolia]